MTVTYSSGFAALPARRPPRAAFWLPAIVAIYGALIVQTLSAVPPNGFTVTAVPGTADMDPAPFYDERYASGAATPSVHSAAAIAVRGGLRAFWYGGAREGAADVAIYTAKYDPFTEKWSGEQPVATRASTAQAVRRYVRKLGNPVVIRDAQDRIWLFYVSVSVGGWSGSAINAMVSSDDGITWEPPRRLVSSPFLNISTLVKGRPFLYGDRSIGLPAYHEFAGSFGELLRVDLQGNVVGKTRLTHGRYSLQPVVVPRSSSEAVAFMRYSGSGPGQVLMLRTRDGGLTWSAPVRIALPNPNAAIDVLAMSNGALAMVFNNRHADREDLSLAISHDTGDTWRVVHAFEGRPVQAGGAAELSYPSLTHAHDGLRLHLLYTWERSRIKHVKFNEDWLQQRQ